MVDIRAEPDSYAAYVPPHSIDAEQAVLGGLLLDNRAWDRIYDVVSERDFYRQSHRQIWQVIERLVDRNKPADVVTVADSLDDDLRTYVAELYGQTPSAANIRQHAQIVRDRSILRSLITAGSEISESARDRFADPQEALEAAEAKVLRISDAEAKERDKEPVELKQAVFEAIDWLESERTAGIATGYAELDGMLSGGGLQPEQLVIVAGRPSMGKSALAQCIAEHAAAAGKTVAYFALETSRRELGIRAVRWHESKVGRDEAVRCLSGLPIVIDDSPAVTLSHVRVRLRRIRRQRGLHLVVVDYLQLMRHRAQTKLEEISEISRGLKAIAKEFSVPVVALAQLNRGVEARTDKRPLLSDLRESGQIEQDADIVMMCYRDEYYDPQSPLVGYGEIFVRKSRDGPVGDVLLRWDGPRTRWIDYHGQRPHRATTSPDTRRQNGFQPDE